MEIRGYLQTSLIEWPGKISAVLWVAGCNLRCPYCQNKDLVLNPEKLPKIPEEEIFEDLKKRKNWLDAACLTGSEPTLQPDLPHFLRKIKKIGLLTMVETNGTRSEVLRELLEKKLLDRISLDIKGSFDRYPQITQVQVPASLVKESLRLIIASGIDFELRTTVVPTLHTKETLVRLAKNLKELSPKAAWYLQQFVPQNCLDPSFEKIEPFGKEKMEEILAAVKKYVPRASLRGV